MDLSKNMSTRDNQKDTPVVYRSAVHQPGIRKVPPPPAPKPAKKPKAKKPTVEKDTAENPKKRDMIVIMSS